MPPLNVLLRKLLALVWIEQEPLHGFATDHLDLARSAIGSLAVYSKQRQIRMIELAQLMIERSSRDRHSRLLPSNMRPVRSKRAIYHSLKSPCAFTSRSRCQFHRKRESRHRSGVARDPNKFNAFVNAAEARKKEARTSQLALRTLNLFELSSPEGSPSPSL